MADYATEGWMIAHTGGFERYADFVQGPTEPPASKGGNLPEYMRPEKVRQLFELPVEFGGFEVASVDSRSATIEYAIKKTGPHSHAVLYYDTKDCISFAHKENNGMGSKAELAMNSPERTWQHRLPEQDIKEGTAHFKLDGLIPQTTYYFRLFVGHDEGKSWDYESGHFTTKAL